MYPQLFEEAANKLGKLKPIGKALIDGGRKRSKLKTQEIEIQLENQKYKHQASLAKTKRK